MEFLLEPDVTFLNHGSFGACPRVVHEEYQRLQRRLEAQPVRFLQRELPDLLSHARTTLAEYLGAGSKDVVFVPNPTFAVNEIARSLPLGWRNEVLMSDHEYGACLNAWQFASQKKHFRIRQQPISVPSASAESIADQFWAGVTNETAVIFLSHITSPTALQLPVETICRRAAEYGIITVIDGAHAPGQLELHLDSMLADFYVGTCHKWMCAPKGSAFLYAHPEIQYRIEPLVVGWGWGEERRQFHSGSDFLDYHEWIGTHDPSAYLTVPSAIAFQRDNDWKSVQQRCRRLASQLCEQASEIPNVERVHDDATLCQMALLELPASVDAKALQAALYDQHRVEVPVLSWQDRVFVRASLQAYNTPEDVDRFCSALRSTLGKHCK